MGETQAENNESKANALLKSLHWQAGWGNVVIAALGLFNLIVLSSTLSAFAFGQWGVFISGMSFLELLRTGLVQSALIRFSSGLNELEERPYLSAGIWLSTVATLVLLLFLAMLQHFFSENEAFYLFIHLAPVQLVAAFPLMFGLWRLNAYRKFMLSFRIRLLVFGFFTLFVILHGLSTFSVLQIAIFYIIGHAIASIICLYNGLTDLALLQHFPKKIIAEMLRFGRYAMGSAAILNLLKSADTLLLGAFAPIEWVAIYHLPIRLTEWSDLLIRSMVANAYPRLTQVYNTANNLQMKLRFRRILGMYAYTTFLLSIIPSMLMIAVAFILANPAHLWLWGLLAFASLIAPFFRFLSIGFEALNRPMINFAMLLLMLSIIILGDLVAIRFLRNLTAVALGTVVAYLFGIYIGFLWFNKEIQLNLMVLFKQTHRWLRWKWKFWMKEFR